ncbi:glycosyltransferase family 1 protein [Rhodococcus sp. 1R11]|uniref:glycosyltransferase n=1 Tax=Rhodococcus sp. 1R11 TaxID=2559614 RepID=UPI001071DEE4|nr:glycosyltransferase [Rhodococcus sp. 1R11]TFI41768.1 glycosyltransferase family 1 protein [Rhodococcus sp. 1R11]
MSSELTMLALGRRSERVDEAWARSGRVTSIVRFEHAAPSGVRFGKRVFGIAMDSFLLAAKARPRHGSESLLCANPWIAVALRAVGVSAFAVTGLYAVPGTNSWKLLRRSLKDIPIVTTAEIEAEQWVAEGGRATAVLYGNTFGYPSAKASSKVPSIFIGGTSDRDTELINSLVDEVRADTRSVRLIIADGSGSRLWRGERGEIEHFGRVSSEEFGRIMSTSDVVFLPILNKPRASGHMVCVGALECGIPVVSSECTGMDGYVDGRFVTHLQPGASILNQLIARTQGPLDSEQVRGYWTEHFSLDAYIGRVLTAVDHLTGR